jgi:hypothetical protein
VRAHRLEFAIELASGDQPLPPGDLDGAAARLRAGTSPFDADYVDNVVLPSFLNSIFDVASCCR